MSQPNFAADILKAAGGETIEAIEIFQSDDYHFLDDPRKIAPDMLNRTLTWDEAKPLLDYEYDDGFGGQDCHDIHAWTQTRVLYIHEYDGSTSVESVPRNPKQERTSHANSGGGIAPDRGAAG